MSELDLKSHHRYASSVASLARKNEISLLADGLVQRCSHYQWAAGSPRR